MPTVRRAVSRISPSWCRDHRVVTAVRFTRSTPSRRSLTPCASAGWASTAMCPTTHGARVPPKRGYCPATGQRRRGQTLDEPRRAPLRRLVDHERAAVTVYPPAQDVLRAFQLTPYADMKVVILGQEPYHRPGQARGLAFSVPSGTPAPPSLQRIRAELAAAPRRRQPHPTALSRVGKPGRPPAQRVAHGARARAALARRLPPHGRACEAQAQPHRAPRRHVIETAHPAARANAQGMTVSSDSFVEVNQILAFEGRQPIDWSNGLDQAR